MKIYDISQEVFTCEVYPGDKAPERFAINRMSCGALYNLTDFSMCAHNGTHIDAPFHFINDGKTVDQLSLDQTVGFCFVAAFEGKMKARDALSIINSAKEIKPEASKRILIKGNTIISPEAARAFAKSDVTLIGVESQSIGELNSPVRVHKVLLEKGIVILEGIKLKEIQEGTYFLCAAPLLLGGCDGAPTRAILIDF